jgi:hypothetical protein
LTLLPTVELVARHTPCLEVCVGVGKQVIKGADMGTPAAQADVNAAAALDLNLLP